MVSQSELHLTSCELHEKCLQRLPYFTNNYITGIRPSYTRQSHAGNKPDLILSVEAVPGFSIDFPTSPGSVPELCDLPPLDTDSLDNVTLPDTSKYPTSKKRGVSVQFSNCGDQHPLSPEPEAPPSASLKPKSPPLMRTAMIMSPIKAEELVEFKDFNKSARELTVYSAGTYKLLPAEPEKRFLRSNPSYLRKFIAQKNMYLSGKLNGLQCGPYMHPRSDGKDRHSTVLGISCKLNKQPRKRHWVQLN